MKYEIFDNTFNHKKADGILKEKDREEARGWDCFHIFYLKI